VLIHKEKPKKGGFLECLRRGTRESFFKKKGSILPRVLGRGTQGRGFLKNNFLPRVLHSGKRIFFKKKQISSPGVALEEEGFF
jgi:hypothetical protein